MYPNQDIPSAIGSAAARSITPILTSVLPLDPSSSLIIPQLLASAPALYSSFILTLGSLPSSAPAFYSSPQSADEFPTAPFVVDLHPSAPKTWIQINGDRSVDLDELMEAIIECGSKEGELMDAFLIFDIDKNGFISAKELQRD
ncbi:hypothetical protein POTOM_004487 [Populus tomentosa]|uniref:EF-hand domain-containing protein n=1 Tax=Populus tomentosa TaxID=118781 RepID=A0A8X8D5Q4_POPTO|nr:hypothetical protein POTOM_004487 [Populus tomentosa]